MNKAELVEAVAHKVGLTKSDVEKTINGLVQVIVKSVSTDDKVSLVGLGTFERTHRASRTGINPTTKQKITIQAKNAPKFKAAKAFKEAVA